MSWLLAYAILGTITSLIAPLLLTERHEWEIRKLGGGNARAAVCVIAGVVWPVLLVEYTIRGLLVVFRALRGLTWLGVLNFVVLQWFGVRLARTIWREEVPRYCYGSTTMVYTTDIFERRGWRLLRWIVPLTGWWSDYRWIAGGRAAAARMARRP